MNVELIALYWRIGRDILERQERDGWGARVVDRLATDLRAEFGGMQGVFAGQYVFIRTISGACSRRLACCLVQGEAFRSTDGSMPRIRNISLRSRRLSLWRRRQSTTTAMTSDGNCVRFSEPALRSLNCLPHARQRKRR